jgi:transposase
MTNHRCEACGNKTRFDVYDTLQRRRFEHADLGGEITVDSEEILSRTIGKVVCCWCDRSDSVVANHTDR